jgi:Bacterial mobilisation protein (MobC)
MARKKEDVREDLLSHPITVRITETEFSKLNKFVTEGSCSNIGDAVRAVLNQGKITLYHKDISLNGPMEQLAGIRKELKAIGVNINQITRQFNSTSDGNQKMFHTLKVSEQYKKVDEKVSQLLEIVSKIAVKWLQE